VALVAAAPTAADTTTWSRRLGPRRWGRPLPTPGFNRPTDILGVAPRIARLRNNDGPTQTMALRKGSAAINKAKRSTALLLWTAMKEGLPGGTLSVSSESEVEEARCSCCTLDWISVVGAWTSA
jgi:hypothetical protein